MIKPGSETVKLSEAQRKRWHIRATGNLFDLDFEVDCLADYITPNFLRRWSEVTITCHPPLERDDVIIGLRRGGKTVRQIGDLVGITGGRVHQILADKKLTGFASRSRADRRERIVATRKFVHRAYMLARKQGDRKFTSRLARALGSQGVTQDDIYAASLVLGEDCPAGRRPKHLRKLQERGHREIEHAPMTPTDDGVTANELWALQEAAKPSGIFPHAESTKEFLVSLETRGWLRQSEAHPVWFITDAGRARLAAANKDGEHD